MYHVLTAAIGRTVVSPSIYGPKLHSRLSYPSSESDIGCCAILNHRSLFLSISLREYSTEDPHEWW